MKKWQIDGYAGWYDYDGPIDNNIHMIMEMDDSVTKKEIEALLNCRYWGYRVTCFSVIQCE